MYFGWNLGLAAGGTAGLAIATAGAIVLYITFTFSYTELACAIPRAGGVFDYATRGLNRDWGFVAGVAQLIEFVFAPPAIAAAIGAYFNLFFPAVPVTVIAVIAYLVFTALNIYGVRAAAGFELVITIFAVLELLIFSAVTLPHFSWRNVELNAFPYGWKGVWAAIPFAVWFFLGLEGVANVAEEAVRPQRNVLLGFGSALATLIVLCVLVFLSSVGVAGWEAIVYPTPGAEASDKPLPLALSKITGTGWVEAAYHLLDHDRADGAGGFVPWADPGGGAGHVGIWQGAVSAGGIGADAGAAGYAGRGVAGEYGRRHHRLVIGSHG